MQKCGLRLSQQPRGVDARGPTGRDGNRRARGKQEHTHGRRQCIWILTADAVEPLAQRLTKHEGESKACNKTEAQRAQGVPNSIRTIRGCSAPSARRMPISCSR